jgi:hypothetical protein
MAGRAEHWTGIDETWSGVAPMYWSHWDSSTSISLTTAAGLNVLVAETETTIEHDQEVNFLWMIARKRADSGLTI